MHVRVCVYWCVCVCVCVCVCLCIYIYIYIYAYINIYVCVSTSVCKQEIECECWLKNLWIVVTSCWHLWKWDCDVALHLSAQRSHVVLTLKGQCILCRKRPSHYDCVYIYGVQLERGSPQRGKYLRWKMISIPANEPCPSKKLRVKSCLRNGFHLWFMESTNFSIWVILLNV